MLASAIRTRTVRSRSRGMLSRAPVSTPCKILVVRQIGVRPSQRSSPIGDGVPAAQPSCDYGGLSTLLQNVHLCRYSLLDIVRGHGHEPESEEANPPDKNVADPALICNEGGNKSKVFRNRGRSRAPRSGIIEPRERSHEDLENWNKGLLGLTNKGPRLNTS